MTGTAFPSPVSGSADVEAARLLLDRMGIQPEELLQAATGAVVERPPVPTFAEYMPVVAAAVGAGARKTYGSYWNRIVRHWADRRIDEPSPSQIKQLIETVQANAVSRRNGRGGRGSAEHLVAAFRCLYSHAVADGFLTEAENPAIKVAKPRRLPSTRRALPDARLAEVNQVAASTGNDPVLDCLLLRLHTETACRRGGALALRPVDLDADQCLIRLREKGGTVRWQPVSPTLMAHLCAHAAERGSSPGGALLRYANGNALTYRRYDHLWARLAQQVSWVAVQQVSTHWLRHTTLTWVERNFGYAVARAYAGHTDGGSEPGATATYIRADITEVATALAALTGEPHPLALD